MTVLTDRHRDGGIDEIPLPEGVPGRLWLCGKHVMGPGADAALARVGATHVVCLVERFEIDDRYPAYVDWLGEAVAAGRALWFPVPDLDVLTTARMQALFDHVVDRLRAGEHVIVHCAAGIGRSGTTAVAVLLHLGMDLPDALTHVRRHRPMGGPEVGAQLELVRAVAAALRHPDGPDEH